MAVVATTAHTVRVTHPGDIGHARRLILELAAEVGFTDPALDELAIVVNELATNLVKHDAVCGTLSARRVDDRARVGIEIISHDHGPGIADVFLAEVDGESTCGTNGNGLGAVRRLTDWCEIRSNAETGGTDATSAATRKQIGTTVTCGKWTPNPTLPPVVSDHLDVSVRTRCFPGEKVCGDQYFVNHLHGVSTVCVIDGLGHGLKANKAATAALDYVNNNFKKPLKEVFDGTHRTCAGTRGVAMTMAKVDLEKRILTYAAVGNVTLRVLSAKTSMTGVNMNGTLGLCVHHIRVFEEPWIPGSILLVHSDGISEKWQLSAYPGLSQENPQVICERIYRDFRRGNDDATLVVGK